MFIFFLCAVVLVVLALGFILPAMLGTHSTALTDQQDHNIAIARERLAQLKVDLANNTVTDEDYQETKRELEQTLADDLHDADAQSPTAQQNPLWTIVIALGVPVIATGLYLGVGTPATITEQLPVQVAQTPHATQNTQSAQNPQSGQSATPEQQVASVEAMVGNLAQRLEQNPDDAEGWMMLARSYSIMGQHDDAISAYETLHQLVGDQPEVLAQYAGALIVANQGAVNTQAQDFLTRALAINQNEPRALWLSGIVAQQQGDSAEALRLWRHLETLLEPGSEPLSNLQQMIAQVEQETPNSTAPTTQTQNQAQTASDTQAQTGSTTQAQTQAQTPTENQTSDTTSTTSSAASITVNVALSAALSEHAAPDDTVFIFARATQGPPMPLAVVRKQVKDLPIQVTLDDAMAMIAEMSLSKFEQVTVGARISKTGNALPQSGDLQGLTGPVSVTDNNTTNVTIDEIVP